MSHDTKQPVPLLPYMPTYGNIPWDRLKAAVGEANGGGWNDQDAATYIGHQAAGINMNSLNRIVTMFVNEALGAARVVHAEAQGAEPVAFRSKRSASEEWWLYTTGDPTEEMPDSGGIVEPLYLHPPAKPDDARDAEPTLGAIYVDAVERQKALKEELQKLTQREREHLIRTLEQRERNKT